MVRKLIDLGFSVNDPRGLGGDVVLCALSCSRKIFDLLVSEGLNMNIPRKYGVVPLIHTIPRKYETLTSQLLDAGVDITASNSDGRTALHEAASSGSLENTWLFVSRGARVSQADRIGWSALHIALSKDNATLTDYLFTKWTAQGLFTGQKKLTYVALENKLFDYAKRIADSRGADEGEVNIGYLIRLHSAAIYDSSDLVLTLLRQYHDATDQAWLTGLFRVAISAGSKDTLKVLLDFGLDAISKDLHGDAPIHLPARSEHEVLASILLDAYLEIETLDELRKTLLLLAVEQHRDGTFEKLLSVGANASHANYEGATALNLTFDLEKAQAMMTVGADMNAKDNEGNTTLHFEHSGDFALVQFFFNSGADISAHDLRSAVTDVIANSNQAETLLYPKESEFLSIVQLLLDSGADVNAQDSDGRSPLRCVSEYEDNLLVFYLKYNPEEHLADGKGRTPKRIALTSDARKIRLIMRRYLESQPPVIAGQ